jgi:hypothetical protein
MHKRFNELSFVIGLFFTIVALILLIGSFLGKKASGDINIYTGLVFLAFGIGMIFIKSKQDEN